MRNSEEETQEIFKTYDQQYLIDKVKEQLDRMEDARKKLESYILTFQAACMDAGFKIAQIQYKIKSNKNDKDEEWQKWDLTSEKQ